MTAAARNVYQRKLAVMAKCDAIKPDKTHPAHKFEYVSIQTLSNHLRKFLVEEGLDVSASVTTDGAVVIELVNADNPEEKIVSTWPVIDGDKGWAYSVKYPLVRLFLVGDGEESDEKDMADRSAATATRTAATARERSTPNGSATACPGCGKTEFVRKGANRESGAPEFYCYKKLGGCGKVWPVGGAVVNARPAPTATVEIPAGVDDDWFQSLPTEPPNGR